MKIPKIPSSVNDLTVNQFVRLDKIKKSAITEIEKTDKVIELFTGLGVEQTDELPLWRVEILCRDAAQLLLDQPTLKVKRVLWMNGKRYVGVSNEKQIKKNQFVAIENLLKDPVANMNKILAVIYLPWRIKQTIQDPKKGQVNVWFTSRFNASLFDDTSSDFHHAKIGDVFGQFFFVLNRLETLNLISQASLTIAQIEIEQRMVETLQGLQDLGVSTDGTISQIRSRAEILLKRMN